MPEIQNNYNSGIAPVMPKKNTNDAALIQGLVALGMVIGTFVLAFMVYIPYLNEAQQLRDKQTTLKADIAKLNTKYTEISGFGADNVDTYLAQAVKYVPDDIKLGDLGIFINNNAVSYKLQVDRLALSENKQDLQSGATTNKTVIATQGDKAIILGRIEGPFGLSGTKENIFRFLDFLVDGGYATNFDAVAISPSSGNNIWSVNFTAAHHFLAPVEGIPAQAELVRVKLGLLPTATPTPSVTPSPTVKVTSTPSATPKPTVTVTPTVSP